MIIAKTHWKNLKNNCIFYIKPLDKWVYMVYNVDNKRWEYNTIKEEI